ncbi:MAG TPA: efflux RND transporter periplasmic adaptor subunit, partial [Orrella sp.]
RSWLSIKSRSWMTRAGLLAAGGLISLGLAGCGDKPKPPQQPPPKVTAATPAKQTVQNYVTFDGTAEPLLYANLEARVPGYLEQILFQDGAKVKKGDLLFVIEQDQYQEEVALNQAIYNEAQIEFDRQSTLLEQKATSQAAVDSARSKLQQAQANLALAKINLGYTEVRAPFDGVMGRHLIDVGNYLGTSPDGIKLAEIRQIQPLYVYFSMSETELLDYLRMVRQPGANDLAGLSTIAAGVGKLPVYAALQGEKGYPHTGVLDFAASDLSSDTGTLQLRAQFPNTTADIVPGVYARVLVFYGKKRESLLVPFSATMRDQLGNYVYVLDADKKAQRQDVTLGQQFGALVEVTKGLKDTDKVVIDGFVTLSAGLVTDPKDGEIKPAVLPGQQPSSQSADKSSDQSSDSSSGKPSTQSTTESTTESTSKSSGQSSGKSASQSSNQGS